MTAPLRGIALIGSPGSGKSSIAQALVDLHVDGRKWERRSFASTLKDELACLLCGTDWLNSNARKLRGYMDDVRHKDSFRGLLQALGMFRRNTAHPDYWVKKTIVQMFPDRCYVVDDCRMPNEYEALRNLGFKFVRLADGPHVREMPADQAGPESEQHWPTWDVDLELPYSEGVDSQAQRIVEAFGLVAAGVS